MIILRLLVVQVNLKEHQNICEKNIITSFFFSKLNSIHFLIKL
jgi:hypothetical protein